MSNATVVTAAPERVPPGFWKITPRIVMAAFLPAYVGIGADSPAGQSYQLGSMALVTIWAVALVTGGILAQGNTLRWVGFSWIVTVLFPVLPMLLLMASGALVNRCQDCVRAAVLGLLLFPLAGLLPGNPVGVMLIACAFLLAISTEHS
ncbi:MAG: hypothetical protein QF405_16630 [Roseibacillus sp.]|nr:hypothetical protein [Roseibacillus sp.]MDP6206873.1 hypothetical protein [Roseibacillus sp.]MDP7309272.1 hypothetical protein [Roseibacillus sp.]HJM62734.1 hypothetical protein [Roseibacillus sp.]